MSAGFDPLAAFVFGLVGVTFVLWTSWMGHLALEIDRDRPVQRRGERGVHFLARALWLTQRAFWVVFLVGALRGAGSALGWLVRPKGRGEDDE